MKGKECIEVTSLWPSLQHRDQLIQERKGDAAVLVDIPRTPGAEEFGRSPDDAVGNVYREGEGTAETRPKVS